MRPNHPLRYLTFTVPVVLAIALACSDSAVTAPQKFLPPEVSAILLVNDDVDGVCQVGDLKNANGSTADRDANQNGLVCVQHVGGKKK